MIAAQLRRFGDRTCRQLTLLALVLIAACGDGGAPAQTGVRLTIEYPQGAPVWLRINGSTADGQQYGPNLLPDPPRPLAPDRETVLLQLPDAMDGEVLMLVVSGLNAEHTLQMRGIVRTEVVRHTVQAAYVSLKLGVGCSSDRSSSVYCTGDEDAGMTPSSGSSDAGMPPVDDPEPTSPSDPVDAGTIEPEPSPEPDAAAPDPVQEPEPPEEPMQPEEPEPVVHVESCEAGRPCDFKCPGGEHCVVDCGASNDCKPTCKNATCEIDCSDAERCHPTCEGRNAVCEITCGETACADVKCEGDAQCLLHCPDGDCELDDD